jgi:sortase A
VTAAVEPSVTVTPVEPFLPGDPLARLEMPTIGTDHIVVAGIGVEELRLGPGHFPDTPLPGQFGNAAIAGHRTTYGQPFHDVDQLVVGDDIVVTTDQGRFTYVVSDINIVLPSDYQVVSTVDRSRATLTLTSCHPKWSAAQRIIVHADLDPERSDAVGSATDYRGTALWGDPVAVASEEPVPVASITAPTNANPTSNIATSTTLASATPTSTTPAVAPSISDSTPPPAPIADAFARGWFHDPAALWHVAAWGAALAVLVWMVLRISRRRRSHLVGLAYGLIPGLVLLYFVYENVNRLLPPDL